MHCWFNHAAQHSIVRFDLVIEYKPRVFVFLFTLFNLFINLKYIAYDYCVNLLCKLNYSKIRSIVFVLNTNRKAVNSLVIGIQYLHP